MNTPKIGQTEEGHSFIGGDPSNPESWLKIGTIEEGYQFTGGDPAQQTSWKPVDVKPAVAIEKPKVELPTQTSGVEALAGGIASGGTMGFADEAMGGIKALGAKIGVLPSKSKSVFDEGVNMGDEYVAQRDDYRDYQKLLKGEHPKTFTGGQIGGGVACWDIYCKRVRFDVICD